QSYAGDWINNDPNTNGITRMRIAVNDASLIVQPFGKCCDWPARPASTRSEPVSVHLEPAGGAPPHDLSIGFADGQRTRLQVTDRAANRESRYMFHSGTDDGHTGEPARSRPS